MNYRHAFHAGNFADVMKHALLAWTVEYLKRKPKPFLALDSHAGAGLYRLDAPEAARTGEWRDGIARVLAAADVPAETAPYLATVRSFGAGAYPGSPLLLKALLRKTDRLVACERHPEDAAALALALGGGRGRLSVLRQDGYGALRALPPPERRGLVLIDPPYEAPDEFDRVVAALKTVHRLFATGTVLAWYPIKAGWGTEAFLAELSQIGLKRALAAELRVTAEDPKRLTGSGLVVVNPPFGFEEAARRMLDWLARVLGRNGSAAMRLIPIAQDGKGQAA
jgi:23S rRNA (adenine2030-N6)-methyltransferase